MRRAAALAVLLVLFVLVACGSGDTSGGASIPDGAREVDGGCGTTTLYTGATESWATTGPKDLVQASAHEGNAVAFLFGDPLRAGEPENPANKILWVVKEPRNGSDLTITGRPVDADVDAPGVSQSQPADSGPGEIYPSIVNVPAAGCWRFTLEWNGNTSTIELPYTEDS